MGAGGLSGAPVHARSTEVIRYLHEQSKGAFPLLESGNLRSRTRKKTRCWGVLGASVFRPDSRRPCAVKRINKRLMAR